jgi:hypothetical protein
MPRSRSSHSFRIGGVRSRTLPVALRWAAISLVALPTLSVAEPYSIDPIAAFPFPTELVTACTGQRMARVLEDHGVRNVWAAEGPSWRPRQLTTFSLDDGLALTQLTFTADGSQLVFVRGGDHGSNWPSPGGIERS